MYLYNIQLKRYATYNRASNLVNHTAERSEATSLTEKECKKLLAKCTKKLHAYIAVSEEMEVECQETVEKAGTKEAATDEDTKETTTNKPITDTAGGDETKKTKRRPFTQAERMQVYTRDRGICGICGAFVPPNELTIDHVIPISKGGTYELNNLQCCCRRCNLLKADALPEEFLDLVVSITKYQITEKANKKMRKNLNKALKKAKKRKPKEKKKSKK